MKALFAISICALVGSSALASRHVPTPGSVPGAVLPPVQASGPEVPLKAQHVLYVIFENEDYTAAINQPYFAELSRQGALLSHFHAETHPSQPNYIAMIAGSTLKVKNDFNVTLNAPHLGDLLEKKGLTWKAYAEDFPGNCFLGAEKGQYARKHVPFLSFANVQSNPQRCANIVNGSALFDDAKNSRVPNFAMYIPNLDNDGHDTGIAFADRWARQNLPKMINALGKDTLIVVTFDEDSGSSTNSVYTVLLGANVKPGSTSSATLNHIDLLRMVEDLWSLGQLGQADQQSTGITGVFQ